MIATGVYGFPRDEALNIALSEIGRFLLTHEMQVTLVVFDMNTVRLSEDVMGGIEQFIDEHAAQAILEEEYDAGYAYELRRRMQWRRQQAVPNSARSEPEPVPTIPEPSPLSELGELERRLFLLREDIYIPVTAIISVVIQTEPFLASVELCHHGQQGIDFLGRNAVEIRRGGRNTGQQIAEDHVRTIRLHHVGAKHPVREGRWICAVYLLHGSRDILSITHLDIVREGLVGQHI